MNSKRLVVVVAALLLSALFFNLIFTGETEAQVAGEMVAPLVAAVGGLFLGLGNVMNTCCAGWFSIITYVIEFLRTVCSMVYEGICGAGSGFFMTCAAIWIFCAGGCVELGACLPCINLCGCGACCICFGWIPGIIGGFIGMIVDGILKGLGGAIG